MRLAMFIIGSMFLVLAGVNGLIVANSLDDSRFAAAVVSFFTGTCALVFAAISLKKGLFGENAPSTQHLAPVLRLTWPNRILLWGFMRWTRIGEREDGMKIALAGYCLGWKRVRKAMREEKAAGVPLTWARLSLHFPHKARTRVNVKYAWLCMRQAASRQDAKPQRTYEV